MNLVIAISPTKFVHSMMVLDEMKSELPLAHRTFCSPQEMIQSFEELKRKTDITEIIFTDSSPYTKKYIDELKKAMTSDTRFTNDKNIPIKEVAL